MKSGIDEPRGIDLHSKLTAILARVHAANRAALSRFQGGPNELNLLRLFGLLTDVKDARRQQLRAIVAQRLAGHSIDDCETDETCAYGDQ